MYQRENPVCNRFFCGHSEVFRLMYPFHHLEASIQYLKITVNAFLIYKRIEFSQNLLTRERKFAIIHCKSKIMEENALKEQNKEEEEQKLRTEIKEYAEQMTPEQARMFLEEIKDLKVVHRQQNERNDEE